MTISDRWYRAIQKFFAVALAVGWGSYVYAPEHEAPQPLRMAAIFELMERQAVNEVCDDPLFKACFDVPTAECSRQWKKMLTECHSGMQEELPELVLAADVDPIIEKVYACVIPKWDALIVNRRTETNECLRLEREIEQASQQ